MTTYVCPMHPEIQDHQPSTCPKCGMKLVPREEERATTGRKPRTVPIREKR